MAYKSTTLKPLELIIPLSLMDVVDGMFILKRDVCGWLNDFGISTTMSHAWVCDEEDSYSLVTTQVFESERDMMLFKLAFL